MGSCSTPQKTSSPCLCLSNSPKPQSFSTSYEPTLSWFAQVLVSPPPAGSRPPPARHRLAARHLSSVGGRGQRATTVPVDVSAHVLGGPIARLDHRLRRLRNRRPRLLLRPSVVQHAAWTSTYRFTSSHCGELTALWHFVERTDISNAC